MTEPTSAVVLFSHGSRDPLWRAPIEAVAARIKADHPQRPVVCAYLELSEPPLAQAVAGLVAAGATHVTVVPMFLGTGKHAREDLPCQHLDQNRAAAPARWSTHPAARSEDETAWR